jgi:hypothetical protein
MTPKVGRRNRIAAAAVVLVLAAVSGSWAQNMFYREVVKEDRIYVFAQAARYDTFEKSGGVEIGVAITRLGYGPNGETVVFDSEDAINYYNFKHDIPGEVFVKPKEAPKSPYPSWKISGLVFGDFYDFADHHDAKFDGQQGFWVRRAYLTYEHTFSEKFYGRLRLEANSNGLLAGGNLVAFVKDAYVRWTFHGKQQAWLGIQPSATFDWFDGYWGLRHIEKTPADLYRIDSSRDFALSVEGPIGEQGVKYVAQIGNDSGNGSETDKYKVLRFEGRYEKKPGIVAEGFFAYGKRPSGQDRTTAQGIAGYQGKDFRLAAQYVHQKRKSGRADTPDTKIDIWSGFGVWEFKPKKATVFGRFDSVKPKLGSAAAGLPGADTTDYLALSNKAPFKFFTLGFEYYLYPSIRISPNVEWVDYDKAPDGTSIKKDVVPRLTFFWSW